MTRNTVSEPQKCKIPCKIPCLQGVCVETGAISTASPATHSLDRRLLSIVARNPCILRDICAYLASLQAPKIGNFTENLPKVSSPNRGNSLFWRDFEQRQVRSHCAIGLAGRCGFQVRDLFETAQFDLPLLTHKQISSAHEEFSSNLNGSGHTKAAAH